jgi:hypothetical protein
MEEIGDLFTLDTKIIAHPSVAEIVVSQYDNGKTRFNEFLCIFFKRLRYP